MILCLLISTIYSTYAQKTPEDIAHNFFELYKTDSIDKAVNYLFATNKFSADLQDGINTLKTNLKESRPQLGKFLGYELVVKQIAGHDLEQLTFIVKHERLPLTFRMLFYRPSNDWQVEHFVFDDKISNELEDASKKLTSSELPIN